MSCINCSKTIINTDYCVICYHCGEAGCINCDYKIKKKCITCGNHNKKISDKSITLKLIKLIENNPYHKNARLIYVVIGNFYLTEKNYNEGFKWVLKSANRGDPSSQYYAGTVYFYGYDEVGYNDYKKALYWFTLAAENNISESFKYLGKIYRDGLGVPEDPYRSTVMFALGSIKGNKESEDEFLKSFDNDMYGFI